MPSNITKASRNGSINSTPEQQARELMRTVGTYLKDRPDDIKFVQSALDFATECHKGQKRESGEPYITHPIFVATWLAKLRQEPHVLAAGLLHDTVEDCDVTNEDIKSRFGDRVALWVDGVTKLTNLRSVIDEVAREILQHRDTNERELRVQATFRKLIRDASSHMEVVVIKLVDKYHNVSTLGFVKDEAKKRRTAEEALEVYALLADRVGMHDIKWRMEDAAFHVLDPAAYRAISKLVDGKRTERERYAADAEHALKKEVVDRAKIQAEVSGRVKHLYSIHQKKQAYEKQGKTFNEIHDLIALRIITESEDDCYKALGIVHRLWKTNGGEFDDYISNPKENGYKSIHTTVSGPGNFPLEVQIRSRDMHRIAEQGVAAHSAYKEGDDPAQHAELAELTRRVRNRLRNSFLSHGGMVDPDDHNEFTKEAFGPKIEVRTRDNEVKDMPVKATVLDFAYKVHSELGHDTESATVNDKVVRLNTLLQHGDRVVIMRSKSPKAPNHEWADRRSGYLLTPNARYEVKRYFRKQSQEANLADGKIQLDRLMQLLKRRGHDLTPEEVFTTMGYSSLDDLRLELGRSDVEMSTVLDTVVSTMSESADETSDGRIKNQERPGEAPDRRNGSLGRGIVVVRQPGRKANVGKCCSPQYGEEIIGYETLRGDVTAHKATCVKVTNTNHPERLTEVVWGHKGTHLPVRVKVEGWDRIGFAYDVLGIATAANKNVHLFQTLEDLQHGKSEITFTVEVAGHEELHDLFTQIEAMPDVELVERV